MTTIVFGSVEANEIRKADLMLSREDHLFTIETCATVMRTYDCRAVNEDDARKQWKQAHANGSDWWACEFEEDIDEVIIRVSKVG